MRAPMFWFALIGGAAALSSTNANSANQYLLPGQICTSDHPSMVSYKVQGEKEESQNCNCKPTNQQSSWWDSSTRNEKSKCSIGMICTKNAGAAYNAGECKQATWKEFCPTQHSKCKQSGLSLLSAEELSEGSIEGELSDGRIQQNCCKTIREIFCPKHVVCSKYGRKAISPKDYATSLIRGNLAQNKEGIKKECCYIPSRRVMYTSMFSLNPLEAGDQNKPYNTKIGKDMHIGDSELTQLIKAYEHASVVSHDFVGDKSMWRMSNNGAVGPVETAVVLSQIRMKVGSIQWHTASWMTDILKAVPDSVNKPLRFWLLPGSHDAGCIVAEGEPLKKIANEWTGVAARTQSKTLGEQLRAGARWLDLRFEKPHGEAELKLYHPMAFTNEIGKPIAGTLLTQFNKTYNNFYDDTLKTVVQTIKTFGTKTGDGKHEVIVVKLVADKPDMKEIEKALSGLNLVCPNEEDSRVGFGELSIEELKARRLKKENTGPLVIVAAEKHFEGRKCLWSNAVYVGSNAGSSKPQHIVKNMADTAAKFEEAFIAKNEGENQSFNITQAQMVDVKATITGENRS